MAKRSKQTADAGEPKFEASLEKLEKIVEEMESGDLPLDAILKKYEEGSGLVRYCTSKLTEAEKRIEILMKNKEGELEARPFEADEDDSDENGGGKDKELF
jgi:exodeoxyribonuclease VII small subunit